MVTIFFGGQMLTPPCADRPLQMADVNILTSHADHPLQRADVNIPICWPATSEGRCQHPHLSTDHFRWHMLTSSHADWLLQTADVNIPTCRLTTSDSRCYRLHMLTIFFRGQMLTSPPVDWPPQWADVNIPMCVSIPTARFRWHVLIFPLPISDGMC